MLDVVPILAWKRIYYDSETSSTRPSSVQVARYRGHRALPPSQQATMRFITLGLTALLLAPLASAQQKAYAQAYARQVGDTV